MPELAVMRPSPVLDFGEQARADPNHALPATAVLDGGLLHHKLVEFLAKLPRRGLFEPGADRATCTNLPPLRAARSAPAVIAAAGVGLAKAIGDGIAAAARARYEQRYDDALSAATNHADNMEGLARTAMTMLAELEAENARLRAACNQRQQVIASSLVNIPGITDAQWRRLVDEFGDLILERPELIPALLKYLAENE